MGDARVVARFGTGLVRTSIDEIDGVLRWTRVPGVDNSRGFAVPPAYLSAKISRLGDSPARFLEPRQASRHQTSWNVRSSNTLASLVIADPEARLVRRSLARLGAGLAAWHDDCDAATAPATAPTPANERFLRWASGDPIDDARAGSAWRAHLRRFLGARRWQALVAIGLDDGGRSVDLHGWPSLGCVVVDENAGVEVLTGTDTTAGAPETDIACVLGELQEFRKLHQDQGVDPLIYDHLVHVFLQGYSRKLNSERLARGAVLRIALHSADFATYVGWHEQLNSYAELIRTSIDDLTA